MLYLFLDLSIIITKYIYKKFLSIHKDNRTQNIKKLGELDKIAVDGFKKDLVKEIPQETKSIESLFSKYDRLSDVSPGDVAKLYQNQIVSCMRPTENEEKIYKEFLTDYLDHKKRLNEWVGGYDKAREEETDLYVSYRAGGVLGGITTGASLGTLIGVSSVAVLGAVSGIILVPLIGKIGFHIGEGVYKHIMRKKHVRNIMKKDYNIIKNDFIKDLKKCR